MGRVIRTMRRAEVALNVIALVLGLYLAGAGLFNSVKYPDAATWQPWSGWFVALLVAALYVPVFALYKFLDARQEKADREAAEQERDAARLDADLAVFCQQIAAGVARACPGMPLDQLAVQVWLCGERGAFDRRYRFFLPYDRQPSGIRWRKGVGVAGMAWKLDRDVAVDLHALQRLREQLGRDAFDDLEEDERLGMSFDQLANTRKYAGIVAMRLFSAGPSPALLALLVLDVTGEGHFECVAASVEDPVLAQVVGACARRLDMTVRERG